MTKEQIKKKWENFWYYYKVHTIVAIVVIAALAFMIKQCADRVEPDLEVIIVSDSVVLSQERVNDIEKALAKYTDDVNKDGRKVVECDYMNMNENQGSQIVYTLQAKLMAEISGGKAALFITDDNYFKKLNNQDMFLNLKDLGMPDGRSVKLSKLPDLKLGQMPSSFYNMNLSIRSFAGTTLDKNSNIPSYNNSVKIMKKLLKDGGLIK